MKPVYVSGMGLVSAAGKSAEEHLNFLNSFKRLENISNRELYTTARKLIPRKMLKFMSKSAMLMELAALEALQNIDSADFSSQNIGLYAATGLATGEIDESIAALEASCQDDGKITIEKFNIDGLKALNPLMSFQVLANIPGCIVSVIHGIKGENLLFNPFEDQAANAIFEGFCAISQGRVDAALILSGDDPEHPANLAYLRKNNIFSANDLPNSAGAAIFLSSSPKNALAQISSITMKYDEAEFSAPLRNQLGRMMASAPLAQLIVQLKQHESSGKLSANGQTIRWELAYE